MSEGDTKRLASRLATAEFVALRCRADGDALAATGILARALDTTETPFQATVRRVGDDRNGATDADLVVRIGLVDSDNEDRPDADDSGSDDGSDEPNGTDGITVSGERTPASLTSIELARELGGDPDPVLALAGSVAAAVRDARDPFGDDSTESADRSAEGETGRGTLDFPPTFDGLCDHARENGRLGDRAPGISLPTTDVVDGLAHTTLVHTSFAGDTEATRERCGALGAAENGREVASLLALSVVEPEGACPRAARAVERALRPISLPDSVSAFATLEGYADVLGTVAAERPGVGLALACGYDVREAALSAWRTHARRAHTALRTATVARYDGLCVARLADDPDPAADPADDDTTPMPVATIARLCRDFRSPEPVALVVGDGIGAIAATDDRALGAVARSAARALGGAGGGSERLGEARFDASNDEFVTAVRAEIADGTRDARSDGERAPPSQENGGRP